MTQDVINPDAFVVAAVQNEVENLGGSAERPAQETGKAPSSSAKAKDPILTKAGAVFLFQCVLVVAAFGIWFLDIQSGSALSLKVFAPVGVVIVCLVVGYVTKTFANSCVVASLSLLACTGLQAALNCAHNDGSMMWSNNIWVSVFVLTFFFALLALLENDTYEVPSGEFRNIPGGGTEAIASGVFVPLRLVSRNLDAWREGGPARAERKAQAAAASQAKKQQALAAKQAKKDAKAAAKREKAEPAKAPAA